MSGRYRGVPNEHKGESKAERLERIAREMREYHLNHGRGCKMREKAILKRQRAA